MKNEDLEPIEGFQFDFEAFRQYELRRIASQLGIPPELLDDKGRIHKIAR